MWTWYLSMTTAALVFPAITAADKDWISVTDNILFMLSILYKVATFLLPVFVAQPTLATNSDFIHSCDGSVFCLFANVPTRHSF